MFCRPPRKTRCVGDWKTECSNLLWHNLTNYGRVSSLLISNAYTGAHRVFNTPLTEQGIAGFAIGAAAEGVTALAEIQFADYVFPAIDQFVNEAAKYRYRSASQFDCGGLVVRMPCGAVGHGGLYHSQSPETHFAHTPGLVVVAPRGPAAAKGLLRACAQQRDPCIVLEHKLLYRLASELVPVGDYAIPIGKAEILRTGPSPRVTVVSYGSALYTLSHVIDMLENEVAAAATDGSEERNPMHSSFVELIDLQTLAPWDADTVEASVKRTGRLVIVHEAPVTCGLGAEIAAHVSNTCFVHLEAPIERVCGFDTPFPLAHEAFYVPGVARCLDAIKRTLAFS